MATTTVRLTVTTIAAMTPVDRCVASDAIPDVEIPEDEAVVTGAVRVVLGGGPSKSSVACMGVEMVVPVIAGEPSIAGVNVDVPYYHYTLRVLHNT